MLTWLVEPYTPLAVVSRARKTTRIKWNGYIEYIETTAYGVYRAHANDIIVVVDGKGTSFTHVVHFFVSTIIACAEMHWRPLC
jgi:hypothetical protein